MSSSSGEDDQPLIFRKSLNADKVKCSSQPPKPSPKPKIVSAPKLSSSSDEDDPPLIFSRTSIADKVKCSSRLPKPSPKPKIDSAPKLSSSSDEDDPPLIFRRSSKADKVKCSSQPPKPSPKRTLGKAPMLSSSSDDDNQPLIFRKSSKADEVKCSSQPPKPSTKRTIGSAPMLSSSFGEDDQPLNFRNSSKADEVKCSSQPPKPSPKRRIGSEPMLSSSSDDDDQPLIFRKSSKADEVKCSSQPPKPSPKPQIDSDSEDDKPLSCKIQMVPKGKTDHAKPQVKNEDSDDEKPLSSKFVSKPNVGSSSLMKKVHQNGSADNNRPRNVGSNKRPPDDERSSGQSSVKKSKLSDSSKPINPKPVSLKAETKSDDDDDVPISQRIKNQSPSSSKSSLVKKKVINKNLKQTNKKSKKVVKNSKYSKPSKVPPGSGEGQKWASLVHNGVIFPPAYKPHGVKMLYKGKPVDLTPEQEEVATMFAVMLDTEYMTKPKFKENFWGDWRKILGKNHTIQNLDDCDFKPIYEWHQREKEKKKQMSTEEKKALKEEKMKLEEKYMWAIVDGVKEKVGNFRVEPPGLFRGRGEHPKMGKLKKRISPSDITINIGKGAPIPECPITGESWKEVRHDNTVTWLAYWNDPINSKEFKYVFLAASSSLKGQSDKEKYEKARMLKGYIQGIRSAYTKDFGNKDVTKRQVAVATYLIDKLALRAGNEKDDDEADTVGCCTLKVENVEPSPPNILKFDFLGKDSIRYQNEVEVELPVFKAIQQFRTGKKGSDDLFDKLDTSKLNAHLKELMPGLTAKVFRTYNASITLDDMLSRETKGGDVAEKVVVYNHANKEVAIICNHQRSVSKSHSAQMTRLNEKIDELKGVIKELEIDLARAKKGKPPLKNADGKPKRNMNPEALEKKIAQTNAKIEKMERDKETKEDLKTVALGTSKINYLDPRITVAWCKRHDVPIEKIFNKSLLAKFAWSMDVDPSFRF